MRLSAILNQKPNLYHGDFIIQYIRLTQILRKFSTIRTWVGHSERLRANLCSTSSEVSDPAGVHWVLTFVTLTISAVRSLGERFAHGR